MQRLLAIAWLTIRAAARFRLFYVLGALLVLTVAVLPAVIKHDGTARGFTQITLTYTLGSATVLLGFVTLWLGCGTLAREVEDCQLQMVDVKPVARWQVWLGKWLGIMALNATLLALAGGSVSALLLSRAAQLPTKPVDQQAALRREVLVARAGVREAPPDLEANVEKMMQLARERGLPEGTNEEALRRQFAAGVRARDENVANNNLRRWSIDLSRVRDKVRDQPLHLRTRFFAAERTQSQTYGVVWVVGPLDKLRATLPAEKLAAETFHELFVPPGLLDERGILTIDCMNYSGTSLVFPLEDGLEVLYREGGFGLNLVRALVIILCWLGLLTAIGLSAASGLSFPVAAFVALSVLLVALSSETLASTVQQGSLVEANHETGKMQFSWVDAVALPVFKGLLKVINVAEGFSPIEALSTGRSVTWTELARAFAQVTLLLTGGVALAGITILTRRELGAAQTKS